MTNAKRLLMAAAGIASLFSCAASIAGGVECPPEPVVSGIIVGVQGGYVNTHWSNIDQNGLSDQQIVIQRDYGAGIRPYVGYQLSQYIAAEVGYTYLSQAKVSRWNALDQNNMVYPTISNWAVDASLRLSLPISTRMGLPMGLFTRVGLAWLVSDNSVQWETVSLTPFSSAPLARNTNIYTTTFGFGAYADLTPHVRAEIAWTHFDGSATLNDLYQPSPDFYSIGISYRF